AGYFIAGTGAVIAAKEIFKAALLTASAKCEADLQKAGDTLANGLVTALGAGTALAGMPQLSGAAQALRTERVQGLINRVFKSDITATGVGFTAVDLLAASQLPFKGQTITNAGRAATKHPEYFGFQSTQALRQVYSTDAQLNNLASNAVREILEKGIRTTGAGGRYPNGWITYSLPDGSAASWSVSGDFIGFRGVRK
ncbi:MAG: hypothetical protein GZ090_15245, partial [Oxalobacteraceae bacterium]|nr:hypothetical protein [Oxalobacteraceae bacterium]